MARARAAKKEEDVNSKAGIPSGKVREDGVWGSDVNSEYDYVLRYVAEAIDSRTSLVDYSNRAIKALQGYPSEDRYLGSVETYIGSYVQDDPERASKLKEICKNIRPRKNHTIREAIDTMVASAMGGVAQYECEPYDPNFVKDPVIIDKLNAGAKNMWMDNKIDAMLPTLIETTGLSGATYLYMEKKENSDREIDLTEIPVTEMLLDPYRLKRNNPRFIGHQTKKSWVELKEHLIKCDWTDSYMLKSINEVDSYLLQVEYWITKYNGDFRQILPAMRGNENLYKHLDLFFKPGAIAWRDRNTEFIKHAGTNNNGVGDEKYHADEVEVCYLYDLNNDIQFTIVNRLFIVEAKKNYMTAYIDYTFPSINTYTGEATESAGSAKVHLDHPYACMEYKRSSWMNYAYSPIIELLDTFDDICALESLIYHTISIMTPITFTGNPTDIAKLAQIAGVSGETIKGFIANSVTVLNKSTDLTPALSEIQRLESRIKWILNGPDAQQQSQIIGQRASGTEAALASSMVTQGLNPIIAHIEAFASDLAERFFKFMLVFNAEDWEYKFPANASIQSLSRKEMAGQLRFRAILRNRIKVEARQVADRTVQWFLPMMQADPELTGLYNKKALAHSVIPKLADSYARQEIESWFKKPEDLVQREQAQNDLAREQTEAIRLQNKQANIDLSFVNPTGSEGQFGTTDISRAISPANYDMSPDNPAPFTGGRKPGPNARKLQYGITNTAEGASPNAMTGVDPNAIPEFLTPEALELLQTPEMGGEAENSPMNGDQTMLG